MRIRLPIIAALSGLLVTPVAFGEDLMDIYRTALLADPAIREAEANRLAVMEEKPQARSALLPQITANAGYTYNETDGSSNITQVVDQSPPGGPPNLVPVTIDTETDSDTDITNWNIELRQSLFRWDQWVSFQRADKQATQADVDYQAALQDLAVRVATAYFDVLAAQDTLESEQATKEAIARQLEQAQKRFEVGLIAITDVQEAQAAYDEAIAAEISAKRALATSKEGLREIIGDYPDQLLKPGEDMPLISPDPVDEDEWVNIAFDQNLNVISSQIGAEIARDDVRFARTGHYPTLDLIASFENTDVDGEGDQAVSGGAANPFSNKTDQDSTSIGVRFSIPIYSGGGTSSDVREKVYRHRAAKEQLERVSRQTERETRDAYLGVISEIARVKALKQSVQSNETALKATEAGFEVGTRTTVDVLDARRALFVAETQYARSRYDYIVNVLRLKQAAGTLTPDDVAEVNTWLNTAMEEPPAGTEIDVNPEQT